MKKQLQRGFTLIEMLVIAPIVILAIGAFITVIISMTGEVLASRASNTMSYNIQDALNRIEQDVKQSASFLATNSVTLVPGDNQGRDGNVAPFSNVNGTTLVLNMVATTGNPLNTASTYVYLKDKPNSCATPNANIPLSYNVVYYISGDVLYRRVLMPSTPYDYNDTTNLVCSVPWQVPSCLSGSFCQTGDTKLVEGMTEGSFTTEYYNSAGGTAPMTNTITGTDQVRANALVSATTLSVAINAKQTVAGRSVERSALLRASRLETTSTALASLTSDSVPSAPTLSATALPGAKAKFTWPAVAGATGYTFEFSLNGGANWTTVFSNQNTRTATVSSVYNNRQIMARVTAINNNLGTMLTSGYGTKSFTTPKWENLDFQNNWVNYEASLYNSGQYTRTSAGLVVLRGLIRKANGGAAVSGETVAYLPEGLRPNADLMMPIGAANAPGRLYVRPDGEIEVILSSGTWTSLEGLTFLASDAGYTATPITSTSSGWVTYGSIYPAPTATLDSEHRVNIQGLLKSGTTTDGTNMFTLPSASMRPVTYTYLPSAVASSAAAFTVTPPYTVSTPTLVYNSSSSYTSITNQLAANYKGDGTWVDNSSDCTTVWCTFTPGSPTGADGRLSNSWTHYDIPAHRLAQWTKDSDGLVTLRGIVKSGTTGGSVVMAQLPEGYRPPTRAIFYNICASVYCRIDVYPDGTVRGINGHSASWSTFDNIRFVPDQ